MKNMLLDNVLHIQNIPILPNDFITIFCFLYSFLLCTVVCMHNYHSAHIFMVYNSVQYVPSHSMFLPYFIMGKLYVTPGRESGRNKKAWEFNGTPMHLLDVYIITNQIFFLHS